MIWFSSGSFRGRGAVPFDLRNAHICTQDIGLANSAGNLRRLTGVDCSRKVVGGGSLRSRQTIYLGVNWKQLTRAGGR